VLPNLQLILTFDDKLWLPISVIERVKIITQIKTVRSTRRCVCVRCIYGYGEWLNYKIEIIRNNWYIVQRTWIISEYSKHPHVKASRNIPLIAIIDLLYDVVTVKMDMFCCQLEMLNDLHVKIDNFIVLKSTNNGQKTSNRRRSQVLLNI